MTKYKIPFCIFLLSFLSGFFTLSLAGQSVDGMPLDELPDIIEINAERRNFRSEIAVRIDYGQPQPSGLKPWRGSQIKDTENRIMYFNSMIEALNFMSRYGYSYRDIYHKDPDNPLLYYLLKRESKIDYSLQSINGSRKSNLRTGADQLEKYLPLLQGKKVGILGNQTSIVGSPDHHLVDVLIEKGIDVRFAFAPEHGFRGTIERGEKVSQDIDEKTGIILHSLYGKNEDAADIVASADIMIYDLQDVGARFYTYITTLHRLMQLCADAGTPLLVLDRPNPNGDQVNGPVRKSDKFKSAVSFHKIAMVHGLTVGELAKMINGEGWLDSGAQCDLTVIPVEGYTHSTLYELPVIPSPSLPNYLSVRLYPSLCLFEGTDISVARGTDFPFQAIGYANPAFGSFTFTPGVQEGMAAHVEQQGKTCYGVDLRDINPEKFTFNLHHLIDFYRMAPFKENFFSRVDFFDKLAGTDELRKQIQAGKTYTQIEQSWQEDLKDYKTMRKKYLLYPDFE